MVLLACSPSGTELLLVLSHHGCALSQVGILYDMTLDVART